LIVTTFFSLPYLEKIWEKHSENNLFCRRSASGEKGFTVHHSRLLFGFLVYNRKKLKKKYRIENGFLWIILVNKSDKWRVDTNASNPPFHSALQRRSDYCIPRNETVLPRSQFPHSCICGRLIYLHDSKKLGFKQFLPRYCSLIGIWCVTWQAPLYLMAASTVVYFLIPLAVVTILYMRIGESRGRLPCTCSSLWLWSPSSTCG
jgi:hypothetical protein